MNYQNNDSDSATVVNFAAGKTTQYNFTLTKLFKHGTQLSLENTFSNTIQDPTRIAIFGGDPEVKQFIQTLSLNHSLTKNLLGKSYIYGEKVKDEESDIASINLSIEKESGIINFVKSYVNLMRSRDFLALQEAALIRAKKRKRLIDRRVKDGLNLKVDGLQAQMQLFNAKEQVESARQDFSKAREILSSLLHRPINENDKILKFGEGVSFLPKRIDNSGENNLRLKLLRKQKDVVNLNKKITSLNKKMDLDFSVSYQTNDFDTESSTVLDRGNLGGDRNVLTLALTASIPWGNKKAKEEHRQVKLSKQNIENAIVATTKNNQQKISEFRAQLVSLQKNVITSELSLKLAEKSLVEYNSLYRLGKVSLDQVLAAEESLIGGQKKFIGYLASTYLTKLDFLQATGQILESFTEK